MNKNTGKARKALDRRFNAMKPYENFACPSKGWIRAIRDALGMTSAQLAKRMNTSQPTLSALEKREFEGTVTLKSLEKAAQAMGCRLIYAIVPQESLAEIVRHQAEQAAKEILNRVEQSMNLEKQAVIDTDRTVQFENLVEKFIENPKQMY